MCEAVEFFRQSLDEQGLDAEITHESNGLTDTFHVSKEIAGEQVTYSTTVSTTPHDSTEKSMALSARNIADKFHEYMTDTFVWDGRRVEVSPYNEPEARCSVCGATVELPPKSSIFTRSAELSSPQPTPIDEQTVLESLDDYSRVLLKVYLIGRLRDTCDVSCPNSNKPKDLYRGSA